MHNPLCSNIPHHNHATFNINVSEFSFYDFCYVYFSRLFTKPTKLGKLYLRIQTKRIDSLYLKKEDFRDFHGGQSNYFL